MSMRKNKSYLVISDIHGDSNKLKTVLNIFKAGHYDNLIILGDILYHGPRNDLPLSYNPKECIVLLNEIKDKIIAIRGNCDAEVDQMVLAFKLRNIKFLRIYNKLFILTHGHHLDKINKLVKPDTFVLYGHTHIHKIEKINDVYYINPGSISLPKENQRPSYITIKNNELSIIDLYSNDVIEKIGLGV